MYQTCEGIPEKHTGQVYDCSKERRSLNPVNMNNMTKASLEKDKQYSHETDN